MALQAPVMDPARAIGELGWTARRTSEQALLELLDGMADGADYDTPPLSRGPRGHCACARCVPALVDGAGKRQKARHCTMAACELCGNEYDKPIEVSVGGRPPTDWIASMRDPRPGAHLRALRFRVIGHGVEAESRLLLCALSSEAGAEGLKDRA